MPTETLNNALQLTLTAITKLIACDKREVEARREVVLAQLEGLRQAATVYRKDGETNGS